MARIYPFRALRYDTNKVRMEDVVTQPYDKITPEMQQAYYDRSKYNLIRVILGKKEPGDTDPFSSLPEGETQHNVFGVAGGEHTAMGVQARVFGQQRGVDIQNAAGVARHELGRENAHESCEHNQRWRAFVDGGGQFAIIGDAIHALLGRHCPGLDPEVSS